jgi:hypothetical protein
MRKQPYIQRKDKDVFFGDLSFKGTILPLLITYLLLFVLICLNNKLQSPNSNNPPQQIQTPQTEQTKSGFI